MADGLIPAGDVDERDIRDVLPSDLDQYRQCHFFAGIGGWALALRWAVWPSDRPIWTGSCPCQPFSAAGRRRGFADERHLWPAWAWLISQSRPTWSLANRLMGELQGRGSMLFRLTWSTQATPSGRRYCLLRASAPRTPGTGRSGWPTAAALDYRSESATTAFDLARWAHSRGKPLSAVTSLSAWPTCKATDSTGGRASRARGRGLNLNDLVLLVSWTTPAASDGTRGGTITPGMSGSSLTQQASLAGPARVTTDGRLLTGSAAGMADGGLLSPEHSRWLMGYPAAWGFCGVMATRLSRRSARRSCAR
ncbi:DNA cytosine methyltransferase [Tistrella sp.]|uniref:DNA cytosine methyltransferase n=1 Tax=Tistrella sp. TaxID=2024861 RepID=UPI002AC34BCB